MLREVVDFNFEVTFTDCKWLRRLPKFITLVAKQSILQTWQSNIIREIKFNELTTAKDRENSLSIPYINAKNPSELTAIAISVGHGSRMFLPFQN